jgi:hypothetical protein
MKTRMKKAVLSAKARKVSSVFHRRLAATGAPSAVKPEMRIPFVPEHVIPGPEGDAPPPEEEGRHQRRGRENVRILGDEEHRELHRRSIRCDIR